MFKYKAVIAVRSRKIGRFLDNKEMESNYFYSLMTQFHFKINLIYNKGYIVPKFIFLFYEKINYHCIVPSVFIVGGN